MMVRSFLGGYVHVSMNRQEADELLRELTSHAGEYVVRDGREISKEVPYRAPALRRLWELLQK